MFNFFKKKRPDPKDAETLHREARALGQSGKYDAAIEKLQAAIAIKPEWAYPYYDLAYTYFLKGDSAQALAYYKKTDELMPEGFFTAKTAIYALEGEAAGRFPKGVYMAYMQIEWTDKHSEKLAIARALTEQVPDFAPGWKALVVLTDNRESQLHAIAQGLSKNPDPETKGILLLNKAALLHVNRKGNAAKEILLQMLKDPETTSSNLALAKFTLENIGGSVPPSS